MVLGTQGELDGYRFNRLVLVAEWSRATPSISNDDVTSTRNTSGNCQGNYLTTPPDLVPCFVEDLLGNVGGQHLGHVLPPLVSAPGPRRALGATCQS